MEEAINLTHVQRLQVGLCQELALSDEIDIYQDDDSLMLISPDLDCDLCGGILQISNRHDKIFAKLKNYQASCAQHNTPCYLGVFGELSSKDIQRLEKHDFVMTKKYELRVKEVTDCYAPEFNSKFKISEVSNIRMLDDFVKPYIPIYNFDENNLSKFTKVVDDLYSLSNKFHFYFVSYNDQPVSAAIAFVDNQAAIIGWGVTIPEFRRQGINRELQAFRVKMVKELGCKYVVGLFNSKSRSNAHDLGFMKVGSYSEFFPK